MGKALDSLTTLWADEFIGDPAAIHCPRNDNDQTNAKRDRREQSHTEMLAAPRMAT